MSTSLPTKTHIKDDELAGHRCHDLLQCRLPLIGSPNRLFLSLTLPVTFVLITVSGGNRVCVDLINNPADPHPYSKIRKDFHDAAAICERRFL